MSPIASPVVGAALLATTGVCVGVGVNVRVTVTVEVAVGVDVIVNVGVTVNVGVGGGVTKNVFDTVRRFNVPAAKIRNS